MKLEAVDTVEKQDSGLSVKVPVFPPGPFQPGRDEWKPLHAAFDQELDLPIFWKKSQILNCVKDEAIFRAVHDKSWFERCWLLTGKVIRDPEGHLYAVVSRSVPAAHVISSCSSFEFTAETWLEHRKETEGTGELLLGWMHTHSLSSCKKSFSGESLKNGSEPSSDGKDLPVKSGLFLSEEDITSARKYGFNGPWQVTCVLDSDACVGQQQGVSLREVLGAWGWCAGFLRRRSVNVIKDIPWGMGETS
jgi:hypothetical protein